MTRVLVTNDDGVEGPGLWALAAAVAEVADEVVVAAPDTDHSGAGAAIGRIRPDDHIGLQPVELPGVEHLAAYAVQGPPALCVMIARLGGFGDPPDLVVSGVNPGSNTGRSTLHSGTVGAALTAANFGVSGMAVSVAAHDEEPRFDTAAAVARATFAWLVGAPEKTVLNVNVPNVDVAALRGVRAARLAPFGTVRATIVSGHQGEGPLQMELRRTGVELPPDSDTALVDAGFVAVTSITGIRAAEPSTVADAVESALREQVA